jgi:CheY-like chemotaxis protein
MINTILIAEDLEDNRYLLKSILEKKQFQVTEAENGRKALSLFEATLRAKTVPCKERRLTVD